LDVVRTLLVGACPEAQFLKEYIDLTHPHGVNILEHLTREKKDSFDVFLDKVARSAGDLDVDMVIIAEKGLTITQIMEILELADILGIPLKVLSDKLDVIVKQAGMPVDLIRGIPLVHFEALPVEGWLQRTGGMIRMIVAFIVALILMPLLLFIAILIKVTSKGPVFFTQERIGINRAPFVMYKFRTMYDKADEMQGQLEEFNESGSGLFKIREDPRVTSVGRFLRRFSLDEVPQLINVIRGEMGFVGPRPLPRRDFKNYYEQWHYSRHGGLPGLTCLWQVSGRSDLDFHNMCILDVYYLHNRSCILNLKILLRTLMVVVFSKGAY
jgi:lipopolysaccharide/colanic/teichoic acid biosynthesis glycosyltransferase